MSKRCSKEFKENVDKVKKILHEQNRNNKKIRNGESKRKLELRSIIK